MSEYTFNGALPTMQDALRAMAALSNVGGQLSADEQRKFIENAHISFKEIESKMMQPQIIIDAYIQLDKITPKFVQDLALFSPFGPENADPLFVTQNVYDSGGSKLVGRGFHHIKLELVDKSIETPIQAIAFSSDSHFKRIKEKQPVDICYTIEENKHGAKSYTQLMIKDIKDKPSVQD